MKQPRGILIVLFVAGVGLVVARATGEPAKPKAPAAPAAPAPATPTGPGEKTPPRTDGLEEAILAGGCFWGMEDLIRELPGVKDTTVGYTGGEVPNASYSDVRTGRSGHAEAVKIVFDPKKTSYADLLRFFFRIHDPTTLNRQGNDRGTQYRSAIFTHGEAQAKTARAMRDEAQTSGRWKGKIVTQIVPASAFWTAEDYHQDYLEKKPDGYTCHFIRD